MQQSRLHSVSRLVFAQVKVVKVKAVKRLGAGFILNHCVKFLSSFWTCCHWQHTVTRITPLRCQMLTV